MKRTFLAAFFLLALSLQAQGPSTIQPQPTLTPFDPTPIAALLAQQSTWTKWAGDSLTMLGQNQSADEARIATHDTAIAALQAQVSQQAQLISALQAAVANATTPPPTSTTLTFTACPDGPLNGLYQGVNFGSGFWACAGGELSPAADGQPQRSLTFTRAVNVLNVTWSSSNITRTQAIVLTSASGQKASATAPAVNQDSSFTPGWSTPTLSFTVSANPNTASAPDLKIRSITYQ